MPQSSINGPPVPGADPLRGDAINAILCGESGPGLEVPPPAPSVDGSFHKPKLKVPTFVSNVTITTLPVRKVLP
jgi:hypothetical protein